MGIGEQSVSDLLTDHNAALARGARESMNSALNLEEAFIHCAIQSDAPDTAYRRSFARHSTGRILKEVAREGSPGYGCP